MFSLSFWRSLYQDNDLRVIAHRVIAVAALAVGYFVARWIALRLVEATLSRLVERQAANGRAQDRANRLTTLKGLTSSLIGWVLLFVFVVVALDTVDVDVTGILTTAGVGGLAVGFGAQKLVRDVISGFFIIVEDQFVVGEYVTIGQATGVVEELGLRLTRIRDDQGRLWIIGNGDISVVTNYSRAPLRGFFDLEFPPDVDADRIKLLIIEVGESLAAEPTTNLLAAPEVTGVSAFGALAVTLRVSMSAKPGFMVSEQLKLRERLRNRIAQEGIQLKHPLDPTSMLQSSRPVDIGGLIQPASSSKADELGA